MYRQFLTSLFVGLTFCSFVLPGQAQEKEIQTRQVGAKVEMMIDGRVINSTSRSVHKPQVYDISGSKKAIASWSESELDGAVEDFYYSIQLDSGVWTEPRKADYEVMFKSGSFVPTQGVQRNVERAMAVDVPAGEKQLYFVQFTTQNLPEYQAKLKTLEIEVLEYIPNYCFLIRMTPEQSVEVAGLEYVRAVDVFHPSYKVHKSFLEDKANQFDGARRFTLYAASDADRDRLVGQIKEMKGTLFEASAGKRIVSAELSDEQLADALRLPTVQWVEKWQPIEDDMDNARIQGGADFLEAQATVPDGFTGDGIQGHVLEGIDPNHPDFAATTLRSAPIPVTNGSSTSHGHATFGIVFGSGLNDPLNKARGILPNGQGLYTNYDALTAPVGGMGPGSRYELVNRLIVDHQVMFQTASWGNGRTTEYTAHSAELDRIIFDLDIPTTQSQSNKGDRRSRPQAWAKNVISIGGVHHGDNADPSDDSWSAGGASIGLAEDGRIKPDLSAYCDATRTTGLLGSYLNFGGTSGATPIVAGYVGLVLEMWGCEVFGNVLADPSGTHFDNRPHFTTTKALLIASASQYSFNGASVDLRREHQGWGFPDLKTLYENRDKLMIVNEDDVISALETKTYNVNVDPGEDVLKICMTFADPPGSPMAAVASVNDLTLRVTAPDGTTYWGNNGLKTGNFSTPNGSRDNRDTVECVFVDKPATGQWKIEVIADGIAQDGHVETPELDADFALVALGVTH